MLGVVFVGPGEVRVQEVPDPDQPPPLGALVRVALSGICGTDLHLVRGHLSGVAPGTVIGHEFVGEVVAVGARVERVRCGDRVMASDFTACGRCRWCDRREHWHCADRAFFGTGTSFGPPLAGAQAELVLVPHADTTLLQIPDACPDDAALLIGDNLATAWSALERARFAPGESLAVVGGGAIGQLVALCAQAAGAGPVIVIEPNADRRRFSEAQGMLASDTGEAEGVVKSITDGDGADVVVDAVGGTAALDAALFLTRHAGRTVSVGTHTNEQWTMPVARSFASESSLSFAIGDSIRTRDQLVRMVVGGAIDPTVVIDAHVDLAEAPCAYAALDKQELMKVVIKARP